MFICLLVLFWARLHISGFHLPLEPLLCQGFCIKPRKSILIFLQGLFLWGNSVQGCRPGLICNFDIGVWILCFLAKCEHIRKFLLHHCIGMSFNFLNLTLVGLPGGWCLGMPKRISLWSDIRSKTLDLSRCSVEASLVMTWSNRLPLW